jgi:hypothetical protein
MFQTATNQIIRQITSPLTRVVRLIAGSRSLSIHADRTSVSSDPFDFRDELPISGGYNEAYIFQSWASYNLR